MDRASHEMLLPVRNPQLLLYSKESTADTYRPHHPTSLPRVSTNNPPRMYQCRSSRLLSSPQLHQRPHCNHIRISNYIFPLYRAVTGKQLSEQRAVSINLSSILSCERSLRSTIKCKQCTKQCEFRPKQRKFCSRICKLSCEFRSR